MIEKDVVVTTKYGRQPSFAVCPDGVFLAGFGGRVPTLIECKLRLDLGPKGLDHCDAKRAGVVGVTRPHVYEAASG